MKKTEKEGAFRYPLATIQATCEALEEFYVMVQKESRSQSLPPIPAAKLRRALLVLGPWVKA